MHLTIQYFNNLFENDNRVYYKSMGLGFKILNINSESMLEFQGY